MQKKKIRADIILIAALLAVGLIAGAVLLLSGRQGGRVLVKVGGKTVKTFSLDINTEYEIQGEGGKNLLIINGGQAWIEEADCPDKLCMNMGKINLSGQSLVCLPHKVVIEIEGGESSETSEVDIFVK